MQATITRQYSLAVTPWESSQEVFTDGAHRLGLLDGFHFVEVLDLGGPLPKGTVALILVYPTPYDYEEQKAKDARELHGSTTATGGQDPDVVWLSQEVQNACGPYALFHAVFNSNARYHLAKDSLLSQLQQILARITSLEKESACLKDVPGLWEECSAIGTTGSTSPPADSEEDVQPHFVCFAGVHGYLGMFDGDRKSGPESLSIELNPGGTLPDQALDAVGEHLASCADQKRYHFSTLLALVNSDRDRTE